MTNTYPLTEDHEMIREAVRGFAQDWYDGGKGPERIYQSGRSFDPDAWQGLTGELGMGGIAIDERYGGAGLGDLGRVVVMEELGASLCAVPFLSTCGIVTDILANFGTDAAKDTYLPKIAEGAMSASYSDGHDASEGRVFGAMGADVVDMMFMSRLADTQNASSAPDAPLNIVAMRTDAPRLVIEARETMDPTRSFAKVDFANVAAGDMEIIGTCTRGALESVVIRSFIALAAECIGGAQKCLDITLEYTAQRIQFDRPIASFQAVKHRCADMYIALEAARSATYAAAIADEVEKTEAALIAKAKATDAFFSIAGDAIQMHGGIGFTWEYPLHFFFKRARANRAQFGLPAREYNRLADHIFRGVA